MQKIKCRDKSKNKVIFVFAFSWIFCTFLFLQERDKFYMSRVVVLELLQALKFKSPIPDTNLLLLVQVVCALFYFRDESRKQKYNKPPFICFCFDKFVCVDIGTRLSESTILQKHMISSLPGVSSTPYIIICCLVYLYKKFFFFFSAQQLPWSVWGNTSVSCWTLLQTCTHWRN